MMTWNLNEWNETKTFDFALWENELREKEQKCCVHSIVYIVCVTIATAAPNDHDGDDVAVA